MANGHKELLVELLTNINIKDKDILDIGCGVGDALSFVKENGANKLAGIDVSKKMIEVAKQQLPEADFKVGSVDNLPWPENTFDEIISIEAMYYFKSVDKALEEIVTNIERTRSFFNCY